ncbi:MAG TPA: cell surface protein [Lactobacillus sp.]|nr:cell surface protein [Lactobacillus sp.]
MKRVKWLVGLLAVVAFGLGLVASGATAQAKSMNYQALKYNTNQTSMASGYFVKPASVTVSHHKYVVTMHIRTAKKLTSYPVKVLSVNGGSPKNVRRVKDGAGNSNLYYSFTTTNLKKRINAKLAINVPKVYKATHLISFKFSTNGLPSLKGKAAATAATAKVTGGVSSTKTGQPSNDSKSAQNKDINQLDSHKPNNRSSQKKATSQKPAADSSSASSKASSESAVKVSSAKPQTTSADKKDHSNATSRLPFLIVGVGVIVVVVIGGSLIVMKKKE